MPKRKSAEISDVAPAAAEAPKTQARKTTASKPKTALTKAAHKHHPKTGIDLEAPVTTEATITSVPVNREAIARLAYSYWEERGWQGGSSEQDWLKAERELSKLA